MKSVCKPGFWKLAQGRRSCRIGNQLEDIYKRTTRRNLQVGIFDRPTRAIHQNFVQQPTRPIDESRIVYACRMMSINEPQKDLPKTKRIIMESVFRRQTRIDNQLNNIFRRPTRHMPNEIFRRPTRAINPTEDIFRRNTRIIHAPEIIFQRPTRAINAAQNIFQRQTRGVEVSKNIFARPTRVINASKNIFERSTRRNANQLDIFRRPTRRIIRKKPDNNQNASQLSQAEQKLLEAHDIRPCSVVLGKLSSKRVDPRERENAVHSWVSSSQISQPTATPRASQLIQTAEDNNLQTILYHDKASVSGPIPLERGVYQDVYNFNPLFRVDDFNDSSCASHFFLTRFHPDQYAGLTSKFCRYIYTSQVTAHLLREVLNVDPELLRILNPDVPITVDGVEITCIDVPSYPGALMIMFKSKNKNGTERVELHSGYMYTSAELETGITMWNNVCIDAMITHNNPRILMNAMDCDETVCREEMSKIIDEHMDVQRGKGLVGLIAISSHKHIYSMERFVLPFAESYGLSVWVDAESKHLIDALGMADSNVKRMLVEDPEQAGIHILSDDKFETDKLLEHLGHHNAHHLLAFRVSVINVSLETPLHDRFPLKIYNIPNVFGTNKREYKRFTNYIHIKNSMPH